MNLPKYCFDTHVLVWFFRKSKTLSGKAKSILEEAFLGKSISFIPSIVLLEAFRLSLKDPEFIFPKFLEFLKVHPKENIRYDCEDVQNPPLLYLFINQSTFVKPNNRNHGRESTII